MRTRRWGLVVGLVSLALASPAFAAQLQQSRGISFASGPITDGASVAANGNVVKNVGTPSRGALVHSVTLLCTTGPCQVALFDDTVAPSAKKPRWELQVATGASGSVDFAAPIATDTGLVVLVSGTGATAFVSSE